MILNICVSMVGVILTAAGALKLPALPEFRQGLRLIPYLPPWSVPVCAYGLPMIEMGAGAMVLFNYEIGQFIGLVLFSSFAIMGAIVVRKRLRIPCNCFGVNTQQIFSRNQVALALFVLVLCVFSIVGRGTVGWISLMIALEVLVLFAVTSAFVSIALTFYKLGRSGFLPAFI
jgi:hypothetical protein